MHPLILQKVPKSFYIDSGSNTKNTRRFICILGNTYSIAGGSG